MSNLINQDLKENILKKIEQSSDEEMTEIVRTFLKKINCWRL